MLAPLALGAAGFEMALVVVDHAEKNLVEN